MKATGVVRRIDDLGRIVIPKELRRNLRIKNGDTLEVFVDADSVILKKYSPMESIEEAASKYVESFNGDYKYMKLLKYFIFKDKIGAARNVEEDSDLVTYIENNGQEDLSETWMTELR